MLPPSALDDAVALQGHQVHQHLGPFPLLLMVHAAVSAWAQHGQVHVQLGKLHCLAQLLAVFAVALDVQLDCLYVLDLEQEVDLCSVAVRQRSAAVHVLCHWRLVHGRSQRLLLLGLAQGVAVFE